MRTSRGKVYYHLVVTWLTKVEGRDRIIHRERSFDSINEALYGIALIERERVAERQLTIEGVGDGK